MTNRDRPVAATPLADALSSADLPPLIEAEDPFALFASWLRDAEASEPNDPNAMALATVDPAGRPNLRMVLLKGLDARDTPERGFVFFTNVDSAKGSELLLAPQAAIMFHWKSLERQVRTRGPVSRVTPEEADAYFATRPRLSQIGAWASTQSRPLAGRATFEARLAAFEAEFGSAPVPRPPHWSGYRLVPLEIEFWASRPFRLHDRLAFRRSKPEAPWNAIRLYP